MLQPIKTGIKSKEVSQSLLKHVANKRVREVLEKRFGLKTGNRKTLDAIGREYGITRERVRQIENDGLRILAQPAVYGAAEAAMAALEDHLKEHGGIAAEHHLLASVADVKQHPHVQFLLTVGKPFQKRAETDAAYPAWHISKSAERAADKILGGVYQALAAKGRPIKRGELLALIAAQAEKVMGEPPQDRVIENLLGLARQIGENPYGEYGLIAWPTIRPRGVRDKAYLVLEKAGRPLHFREVTGGINAMKWSKKPAHPQTVHNELIKASSRFVLVGRGLYALREWGYIPGTVSDVMKRVLADAGEPLPRGEIVKRVLEKRFVKENTILLNLQNKTLFDKQADGRYFVV